MSRVASDLDRTPDTQARVLMVLMPFGSVTWPALAISLLEAAVVRNGIACDIRYLNVPSCANAIDRRPL
nr:hypothetical protein Hi04_10k_c4711_00021 [uncultured bacterium]